MGYLGTLFLIVQFIVVVNCVLFLPKDKVLYGSNRLDKTLTDNKLIIPSRFGEKLLKYHRSLSRRNEPIYHTLEKRDATSSCGLEGRSLEVDVVKLKESSESIQAAWVGKDTILIVASDRNNFGTTTVWRGEVKKELGIFEFDDDHSAIKFTVFQNSLQVSPAGDRNTVVVVAYSMKFIFISRNFGIDWDYYNTPIMDFDPTHSLYLSELNPMHMVIRSRNGELFVTNSQGASWIHVASRVSIAELGRTVLGEHLYFVTQSGNPNSNPLYRVDISSMEKQVIDQTTYRFRVDNRYLYISRKNMTGNKQVDDHSRRLYVSNNYDSESGPVGFTEVQLPSLRDQQFYAVMATHETGAFIHVYDNTGSNSGNLYVSDSTGSRFTLSLENHLFSVHEYPLGHYTIYDFYELASTRGVYVTTTVNPGDGGHVTKITFNNGASWQRLKAPENTNCQLPDCSLHLHLRYSQYLLPFYNYSSLKSPMSIKSAPGIIIAHGSVGRIRNDSAPKLYISSDGGHTWSDPGLPQGTYVYGIGDYGNIIAVAPDSENIPYMWFSHNRGKCFSREKIDLTSKFTTRGLLIDPSAASLYGFIMGVEGFGTTDEWRMITLNFKSLLQKPCDVNDYLKVTEHQIMDTCLLGYRSVYNLTKDDSVCYNQAGYQYKPIQLVNCSCSYSDYECGYGFNLTSAQTCSKIPNLSLSNVCPAGAKTYQESVSGFRLIPGDYCIPTEESKNILAKVEKTCTGHEKQSGIHPVTFSSMSTAGKIVGGFFLVMIAIGAAGLTLYCWLKCKRDSITSRDKVYYQRLPLRDTGGKFSANDETSSDEDILT